MRIMGIDASLSATGIVVLEDGQIVAGQWCVIKAKLTGIARVAEIAEKCGRIAQAVEAHIVAIEDYSYTARFTQAYSLGELGGVLRYLLFTHGVRVETWSVATIRKALTGKGNLAKSEMPLAIYKRFGVEFPSAPDALDAWAVAYTAWLKRQPDDQLTAYQREAFARRRAA
jgi:Holliday junction resolvasome RuvABC endonuclease subunit